MLKGSFPTVRAKKIAPREVSSAKKNVTTKKLPEIGSVKSDFDENLHGKNYISKKNLTKPEGQE